MRGGCQRRNTNRLLNLLPLLLSILERVGLQVMILANGVLSATVRYQGKTTGPRTLGKKERSRKICRSSKATTNSSCLPALDGPPARGLHLMPLLHAAAHQQPRQSRVDSRLHLLTIIATRIHCEGCMFSHSYISICLFTGICPVCVSGFGCMLSAPGWCLLSHWAHHEKSRVNLFERLWREST